MPEPRISFVVTARNDNYGGKLIERIETSTKVIAYLAEKFQLQCEYIIVEYNPPTDKPSLVEALTLIKNDYIQYRFITVPASFHAQFPTKIPLLEYIAKNIGIRRARGIFILSTNPDIVFSEDLFAYIASGQVREDSFYRANRHDLIIDSFPPAWTVPQIFAVCAKKVGKVLYNLDTAYISWSEWFSMFIHGRTIKAFVKCPLFNPWRKLQTTSIHENGAGDFLLAYKKIWSMAQGYNQAPHNLYHDGLMLYVLKALGYSQVILPTPIYHIQHEMGRAGRPGIEFAEYRRITAEMQRTGIVRLFNDASWGFVQQSFAEITR